MAGVIRKSFDEPDQRVTYEHGTAQGVQAGDSVVWRSLLRPDWSWDADVKPLTQGLTSCPLNHREYVVAGRIRYLMEDGSETIGEPGEHLRIYPGHRAFVEGDQECILIDW